MITEQQFVSGAMETSPSTIAEVEFDVKSAIETNDVQAVWKPDFLARIATLDTAQLGPLRSALVQKFGSMLSVRLWDAAIKTERKKLQLQARRSVGPLPEIQINARPLRDMVADSLRALLAANNPPSLFVRSGEMVYVVTDERQRPSIVSVSRDHLRGRLDRAANYVRRGESSDVSVPPPVDVVNDILALPPTEWGLPALDVVVEVPTLRPDGTILDAPGYDAQSRMLYQPPPDFVMGPLPDDPMTDDLDAAVALVDEAIGEFPYADAASRANTFGLLLTPIIRPAINGCTPLALIDAPQAGTGKSLLADVFSIITTGRPAAMIPFPRTEDEMQKSIGAILLAGRGLVCFDNLEGILQSPALALVLTAKEYETRILGVSEQMVAPNRATWLVTGNNIRPSGDMPRRCYHIRLDAKTSRPFQGRRFRHRDLLEWVSQNRPALLRALLLLARAWFHFGKQNVVADPLGSFEQWHRTIAGALKTARIDGFLSNMAPLLETDEAELQWENLLSELASEYPKEEEFTVKQVAKRIREATAMYPSPFTLPDTLGDVDRKKEGSLERAMGRSFAKRIGHRFGDRELHLERQVDDHDKISRFRVCQKEVTSKRCR